MDLDLIVSFCYFSSSDCRLTPLRVAFAAWLAFAFGFLDFEAPPNLKQRLSTYSWHSAWFGGKRMRIGSESKRPLQLTSGTSRPVFTFVSMYFQQCNVPLGFSVGGAISASLCAREWMSKGGRRESSILWGESQKLRCGKTLCAKTSSCTGDHKTSKCNQTSTTDTPDKLD